MRTIKQRRYLLVTELPLSAIASLEAKQGRAFSVKRYTSCNTELLYSRLYAWFSSVITDFNSVVQQITVIVASED